MQIRLQPFKFGQVLRAAQDRDLPRLPGQSQPMKTSQAAPKLLHNSPLRQRSKCLDMCDIWLRLQALQFVRESMTEILHLAIQPNGIFHFLHSFY